MPAPSNCICCYAALYDCCKARGKRFIKFLAWISLVTTMNSEKPSLSWCKGGPCGHWHFPPSWSKSSPLWHRSAREETMMLQRLWGGAEHWSCTAGLGYSLAEQIIEEWWAGRDFDDEINATRRILWMKSRTKSIEKLGNENIDVFTFFSSTCPALPASDCPQTKDSHLMWLTCIQSSLSPSSSI